MTLQQLAPENREPTATSLRLRSGIDGLWWVLLIGLLIAPIATAAPRLETPSANSAATKQMLETLDRRGDLTLRESTLEAALFTISDLWGINIVAGEVPGTVNGVFKDAPLREILDSILISNGYAYRPVGESLVVNRLQELGQVNPFFISATIPVGAADVGEVVEAARLMTTPQGQVRAMPSAGAVLVVDFPDRVEKIRELVQQVDSATRGLGQPGSTSVGPQRLEVAYFRTHFLPAADAQLALNVVLSAQGRIAAIDDEDRLLVVDYAENLAMVETVLARIDRPRPQVKIQALIYDINLTDIEEIGINWNSLTSGTLGEDGTPATGDGSLFNSVTKTPFDAAATGGTFTFFSLNADFNLEAVVLALQQADDSRLLASPNVTVVDNEEAKFQSISEIPFQQLTQTGAGGQIGTTSFRDAGISLTVRPKIANDRSVDMQITPEFSRLTGFTPGDNQPIIDRRIATTRVRVQNGQTLMIGGLRQRNDVGDFDGIPLLKDIRYLGHLFRARETQIQESELVVFITPEIVGYSDPLACRDQLAVDTIRCRIDHIPAPEGCPPCGPCNNCHPIGVPTSPVAADPLIIHEARPAAEEVTPEPANDSVLIHPNAASAPAQEGDRSTGLPTLRSPTSSNTFDLPQSDNQPASGDTPATDNARIDRATGLSFAQFAGNKPRRLPPALRPDNSILPSEAAAALAGEGAPGAWALENPLRKSYQERFRASGSLYGSRVAEKSDGELNSPDARDQDTTSRGRLPLIDGFFWK